MAEAIHEKSHLDTHLPELTGLWVVPPTQTDILHTYHQIIDAKGDLERGNTFTFQTGEEADFINLSDSYVEVKFQVECTAGSIVNADNLALTNLFAHGLFERVTLTDKSGRKMSNADEEHYPYQAMLLTLLSKNKNWEQSAAGQLEGWYSDTPGQFETQGAANGGFVARQSLSSAATAGTAAPNITVVFRPFLGMMRQRRLLLNTMAVKLSLTRAKPEFTLISAAPVAGAKIRITSARWFVKRVVLTPAAINFNIKMMAKERALYPIDRIIFYSKQARGLTQWTLENIWPGPMPSHIILAIVRSSAVEGDITQNPYNFANYGLVSLQLTSGSRDVPKNAYEPIFNGTNVTGSSVAREYLSTLEISGKAWGHDGNLIDLASYVGGTAVYAFDMTADGSQGAHWSLTHRGPLSIKGRFSTAPAHAVTIIAVGIVSSVVEVALDRSITNDFTT